jgi:hypothetical protein
MIRSAVGATGRTSSSFKERSQTDSGSRGEAIEALLDSLKGAQQHDEGHRRSEIDRVMQSAARWGAEMARKRPNDPDGWAPAVMWNDHGEPEIVAIRGPATKARAGRGSCGCVASGTRHDKRTTSMPGTRKRWQNTKPSKRIER